MIDLLKKLIAIPRPSRGEDAGAEFLEGYMRGIGLDVKRKGNNLWVESEPESSKPTILLNAHLDTVSRPRAIQGILIPLQRKTESFTGLAATTAAAPWFRCSGYTGSSPSSLSRTGLYIPLRQRRKLAESTA